MSFLDLFKKNSNKDYDALYQEIQSHKEALKITRERYRLATEGAEVGIWDYDFSKKNLYMSTKAQHIIGIDGKHKLITIPMIRRLIANEDVYFVEKALEEHLSGNSEVIDIQFRLKLTRERFIWIRMRGRTMFDHDGRPVRAAGSISNIDEEKAVEQRVLQLAYYDSLTELPNRQFFSDEMNEMIFDNEASSFALIIIDIDNLKAVNDSLGYKAGDMVIENVAGILKKHLKLDQRLYRFGGDEFIIISKDIMAKEEIEVFIEGITSEFQQPFDIDGLGFSVTLSIGVAIYPIDGDNLDVILKHADTALNHAKQKGKNGYEIFSFEMNKNLNERLQLERELRHAITHDEMELYYQPKLDISTRKIVGYEALLRWNHYKKGLIMPMEFIPLAEETGLIIPIGEWVIAEAVKQLKLWHDDGHDELMVSINLSARQLKDVHLVKFFKKLIKKSGVNPEMIELEITETAALYDINYAISILTELKALGLKVSLDDFGTGYSSLNYLRALPVDTLKIDKSFLTTNEDRQNIEIIKSVIALAHACEMNVVAEGVETTDQLAFLEKEQCDLMQGYLFSKPLPVAEAIRLKVEDKGLN